MNLSSIIKLYLHRHSDLIEPQHIYLKKLVHFYKKRKESRVAVQIIYNMIYHSDMIEMVFTHLYWPIQLLNILGRGLNI